MQDFLQNFTGMSKTAVKFARGPKANYSKYSDDYRNQVVYFAEDTLEIIVGNIEYATPLKVEDLDVITKVELDSLGTFIFTKSNGGTIKISIPLASTLNDGLMSKEDKKILEELPEKYATKEELNSKIASVYHYKGTLNSYEALPEDAEVGDTYNIENSFDLRGKHYNAGTNIAWNGLEWDPLGGESLSYTRYEVDSMLEELEDKVTLVWEFVDPAYVISEIKAGGNVKLAQDLHVESGELTMTKNTNLNLNGNTISAKGGTYGDSVVMGNGANVTISNGEVLPSEGASVSNGSATIIVKTAQASNLTLNNVKVTGIYPLYVNSANEETLVTINGGEIYTTVETGDPSNMPPAVYVGKGSSSSTIGGKVIINEGTFGKKGVTNNYLLNVEDILRKQEGKEPRNFIEVFGGKFYNFDPSNNGAEGEGTNFVAEGKKVKVVEDGADKIYIVTD